MGREHTEDNWSVFLTSLENASSPKLTFFLHNPKAANYVLLNDCVLQQTLFTMLQKLNFKIASKHRAHSNKWIVGY